MRPDRSWMSTSTTSTLRRASNESTRPTTAIPDHQSHHPAPPHHRPHENRDPEAALPDAGCQEKPRTYRGSGKQDDPYIIDWDIDDKEDPYNWSKTKRWLITAQVALSTFTISFSSSAYTGGMQGVMADLGISESVVILGISLYVLGFALGPLLFAPLGEMFGRRIVFLFTLFIYTVFQLQGALSKNLPTLLSCRILTGMTGSTPLTNGGGVIADIFNFRDRGIASAIYSTVPFLGPVIGPLVSGFVAEDPSIGWHFNFWIMFILSALSFLTQFLAPETYAPVLLRWRARKLHEASGGTIHYVGIHDYNRSKSFAKIMRVNLSRPFVFFFTEPIILLFAVYISIVYGTLYALFSAFPIVFQDHKGFTPGQGGLSFLGVGFGIAAGTASQTIQNRIYWRSMDKETGRAPPEARLHMALVGGIVTPIGLWWFAWTSLPNIHWIVPILAGAPFGFGVALILQCLTSYLMDTYGIYFASAFAATIVLRSFCAAAFPLFSPTMFGNLGDQWGMSIFAILSTVCMPIPALFLKYGPWIRSKSRIAYKDPEPSQDTHTILNPSSNRHSFQLETIREKEGSGLTQASQLEKEKIGDITSEVIPVATHKVAHQGTSIGANLGIEGRS